MTPTLRPLRAPSAVRPRVDRFLLGAVVVSLLLRVPTLWATPSSDEAGFLLVARAWSPTPDSLYGRYWVDRSPVLIALYRWSDALVADHGPRLLAAALCAVLVVAVHLLAARLAGRTGARVATVVTVLLLANPALTAFSAKGEVLGTPLVVVACVLGVWAVERGSARPALAAGTCAALAVGCKQSLLGAVVFLAVLFAFALRPRLAAWASVGAALPVVACLAWVAVSAATLEALWFQVVGFRADASAVLAASDSHAPVARAHELVLLFVLSGMAPLLALGLTSLRRSPAVLALVAMTVADLGAVVVGGSYWHAYLVPLVPDVALLAALAARLPLTRFAAGLTAVATLAAYAGFVQTRLVDPGTGPWQVGRAVGEVAAPDDTVLTVYGGAEVVQASGLPSPYEHLWSLPMRTLDPRLDGLRSVLAGPAAPTWVVQVIPSDSWGIDTGGRVRALLVERYQLVSIACGPMVWQRKDALRADLPLHCT